MITPISSGIRNSRLRPMAVPITSARSVAMMAISARQPQRPCHPARKGIAAGLREIAPGADAEPYAQRLQDDRHQIGQQRDGEQRVAEFGAAGERGRPVAGIHIADRDEIAGPEECHQLAPERSSFGGLHRPNMPASEGSPRACASRIESAAGVAMAAFGSGSVGSRGSLASISAG